MERKGRVRGFALWSERVDGWSVRWVGVRCAGERERESVRSERAGERERVTDFHAGLKQLSVCPTHFYD